MAKPSLTLAPAIRAASLANELRPRKRTYVGEDSSLRAEDIDSRIRSIEEATGVNLDKMPVLADKTQFFRNIGRFYVPKTLSQIPSRLWHLASTPSHYGLDNLLQHAASPKGDYYLPGTGTVNIGSNPDLDVLSHEVGHWADFERNKGPYARSGLFRGRKDAPSQSEELNSELAATLFARKAMGEKNWRRTREKLETALGTYLVGGAQPTWRTAKEWWGNEDKAKADPRWKKTLPKILNTGTKQQRMAAMRNAWLHIQEELFRKQLRWDDIFKESPHATGDLDNDPLPTFANKRKHQVAAFTRMLLDTEYKRRYGMADAARPMRKAASHEDLIDEAIEAIMGKQARVALVVAAGRMEKVAISMDSIKETLQGALKSKALRYGLVGGGLGAGTGALMHYLDGPEDADLLEDVLGGAVVGGLGGGTYGMMQDLIGKLQGLRAGPDSYDRSGPEGAKRVRKSFRDVVGPDYAGAPGGLDEAARLAQKHMSKGRNYRLQSWTPENIDTKFDIDLVDAPTIPGTTYGGRRTAETDIRYFADGSSGGEVSGITVAAPGFDVSGPTQQHSLQHELTHAALRPKSWRGSQHSTNHPTVPYRREYLRPEGADLVTWPQRALRFTGPSQNVIAPIRRAMWNYATTPEELKAYSAPIKRQWVRAHGKQMATPEDAENALEWWIKNRYDPLKPTEGILRRLSKDPLGRKTLIQQLLQVVMGPGMKDTSKMASDKQIKDAACAVISKITKTIKAPQLLGDTREGFGDHFGPPSLPADTVTATPATTDQAKAREKKAGDPYTGQVGHLYARYPKHDWSQYTNMGNVTKPYTGWRGLKHTLMNPFGDNASIAKRTALQKYLQGKDTENPLPEGAQPWHNRWVRGQRTLGGFKRINFEPKPRPKPRPQPLQSRNKSNLSMGRLPLPKSTGKIVSQSSNTMLSTLVDKAMSRISGHVKQAEHDCAKTHPDMTHEKWLNSVRANRKSEKKGYWKGGVHYSHKTDKPTSKKKKKKRRVKIGPKGRASLVDDKPAKKKAAWHIRTSAIAGRGLFATGYKQKGAVLVKAAERKENRDGRDRYEITTAIRFTNHAHKPNSELVKIGASVMLVATKSIRDDEEILVDYRKTASAVGPGSYITYKGKVRASADQLEKQANIGRVQEYVDQGLPPESAVRAAYPAWSDEQVAQFISQQEKQAFQWNPLMWSA